MSASWDDLCHLGEHSSQRPGAEGPREGKEEVCEEWPMERQGVVGVARECGGEALSLLRKTR